MKNGKGLFGLMIKRKEKGMTQKDLGKIVGVRSEAISCYEVGTRTPNAEMLKKLAKALDCTVDDILYSA